MTHDEQRAIGRLEGELGALNREVAAIHGKLDKLIGGECVTGAANRAEIERHGVRIGKLEGMIAKAILAGFLTLLGGHGAGKVIETVMQ